MINFVLTNGNLPALIKQLERLDVTQRWSVRISEWKSKRSLAQNDWVRKYARDASKHFGYEPDEMYDILMFKHNPVYVIDKETGEELKLAGHFSKLNTKEAAEVQERILRWGNSMGFYWEE